MTKALREAAAKVPVPKRQNGLSIPHAARPAALPAARRAACESPHNARLLLSEYNNGLTGYNRLPLLYSLRREDARDRLRSDSVPHRSELTSAAAIRPRNRSWRRNAPLHVVIQPAFAAFQLP